MWSIYSYERPIVRKPIPSNSYGASPAVLRVAGLLRANISAVRIIAGRIGPMWRFRDIIELF